MKITAKKQRISLTNSHNLLIPIDEDDKHGNILSNSIDLRINYDEKIFVLDFDLTITGKSIDSTISPKHYHMWKTMNTNELPNSEDYKINCSEWDSTSKECIDKTDEYNVSNILNAKSLLMHFIGGQKRKKTIVKLLKEIRMAKCKIYISTYGNAQVVYYFLKGHDMLKYIDGIHGSNLKTKKGCFINTSFIKSNFDPFECMEMNNFKHKFIGHLLKNKKTISSVIFIDDNYRRENKHMQDINQVIVYKNNSFRYEKGGLTEKDVNILLKKFVY